MEVSIGCYIPDFCRSDSSLSLFLGAVLLTNIVSCSLPVDGSSFYRSCFIISFSPPDITFFGVASFGGAPWNVEARGDLDP